MMTIKNTERLLEQELNRFSGNFSYLNRLIQNEDIAIGIAERIIIETKNPKFIYTFAKDVEYAFMDSLANALIETKDIIFITLFARLKDAPIEMLEDYVLLNGSKKEKLRFAENVKSASLDKFAKSFIEDGHIGYIDLFADIKGAPLDIVSDAVIEHGLLSYMVKMAKRDGAPVEKLALAVVNNFSQFYSLSKIKYVYEFILEVQNAPLQILLSILTEENKKELIDKIIETDNYKLMYKLGELIESPFKEILSEKIIIAIFGEDSIFVKFKNINREEENGFDMSVRCLKKY